jgi:hypothetical protein
MTLETVIARKETHGRPDLENINRTCLTHRKRGGIRSAGTGNTPCRAVAKSTTRGRAIRSTLDATPDDVRPFVPRIGQMSVPSDSRANRELMKASQARPVAISVIHIDTAYPEPESN